MSRNVHSEAQRRSRDAGLALRRRLTTSIGVAACGLTGLFALTAATTHPGASDAQPQAPAVNTGDDGSSYSGQFGFNPPAQPPQAGVPQAGRAVSGGS